MSELCRSRVIFDPERHIYTLPDGRELSGITPILSEILFPDKYVGVSGEVLKRAAGRGSMIHEAIEFHDTFGARYDDIPEVEWYDRLKEENGLVTLENEYLVSDEETVASSIDVVFTDYSLADIKTTYRLDMEYLSWQLSIYAWLFERQNPGLKVPALYAVWLPKPKAGKPKLARVVRRPDSDVERLLVCYRDGLPWKEEGDTPLIGPKVIQEYVENDTKIKRLQARQEELRDRMTEALRESGRTAYSDPFISVSYRQGGERVSIDAATLRERHPDIFREVAKITKIKESYTIKTR